MPKPTKEEVDRAIDIISAEAFVKKFYPGFWARVDEQDITQLLTLGHMLFKTHPEYLEATTQARRSPTQ